MAPRDFEVVEEPTVDVEQIIGLLSAGYGRPFTEEWFRWKHQDSPWGPSSCFVARDADGPLGVAFRMTWPMKVDGNAVRVSRLVDGTTLPRALRRGVFRTIVRSMVDHWPAGETADLALTTATAEARAAHLKIGAVALEPIEFGYRAIRPATGRLLDGHELISTYHERFSSGFHTDWSTAALRWRIDPRSGVTYRVASLAEADKPNGIAYRIAGRNGMRAVSITTTWGTTADVLALTRAVAHRERAIAVHEPIGASSSMKARLSIRRGRSLLCIWRTDATSPGLPDLDRRENWRLDNADLEGLI